MKFSNRLDENCRLEVKPAENKQTKEIQITDKDSKLVVIQELNRENKEINLTKNKEPTISIGSLESSKHHTIKSSTGNTVPLRNIPLKQNSKVINSSKIDYSSNLKYILLKNKRT